MDLGSDPASSAWGSGAATGNVRRLHRRRLQTAGVITIVTSAMAIRASGGEQLGAAPGPDPSPGPGLRRSGEGARASTGC